MNVSHVMSTIEIIRYETITKTVTMEFMFYRRKIHNEETGK